MNFVRSDSPCEPKCDLQMGVDVFITAYLLMMIMWCCSCVHTRVCGIYIHVCVCVERVVQGFQITYFYFFGLCAWLLGGVYFQGSLVSPSP